MIKCLFLILALAPTMAFAADLGELRDAIDDIELQIDNVDLDQSKDDIRSDLDGVKQALEDLEGTPVVYQSQPSKGPGYRFVPVSHSKAPRATLVRTPICEP